MNHVSCLWYMYNVANRLEQLISDSGNLLYPEIVVELTKTFIIGLSVDAVLNQ